MEAIQHGLGGFYVGVNVQRAQTPAFNHQPAAEQNTPQPRNSWPHNFAVDSVNTALQLPGHIADIAVIVGLG